MMIDPMGNSGLGLFGRYELLQLLGSGGMAEVYLAREPLPSGVGKILVIKKIHKNYARMESFQQMFADEARIAVNLNHPCVVHTFGYGQIDDTLYLAMEHVDGVDLLRLLRAARAAGLSVPPALAAYVLAQVCKGLDYAHRKRDEHGEPLSIVHRDVSPQNVLLSWDGAVKLADFGIAKASHTREEQGVLRGKYAYMSPEQALGRALDPRSDVYSAGVVLWETITGRSLHGGLTMQEALARIRSGAIPALQEAPPEVPAALWVITLRALGFRPEDRYQTARDMQHDLSRFYFSASAHSGEVIDSARLAAFLAHMLPPEKRRTAPEQGGAHTCARNALPTRTERHNVVVVDGRLAGVPAGTEDHLAREFQRVAENVAYKHRAYIHRLDPLGITCLVGVSREEEHDARQALRLALALLEATGGIAQEAPRLQLALGVQRGVDDATLQVARHLSRAARPGEVLVGGSVYRACRAEWRFAPMPPSEHPSLPASKGSSSGLLPGRARAYRLLDARSVGDVPSTPPARLQAGGRRDELGLLHGAYARALVSRAPQQVWVLGETGLGKRTLLATFRQSLEPSGHLWLSATARSETRQVPYAVLGDLARDLLGVSAHADARQVRRHLQAAAHFLRQDEGAESEAEGAARVQRLLHALSLLLSAEAGAEADYLEALRCLLLGLGGGRVLLLGLQEAHFADAASLEVIEALGEQQGTIGPALFLYTARPEADWPEPPSPAASRLLHHPQALHAHLAGLSRKEQEQIILSRLAPAAMKDALPLCQEVIDQAGGNPLYLLEILDALTERGVLEKAEGGLRRAEGADQQVAIPVPTTVEALLNSRLAQLSTAERECLLVLSRNHPGGLTAERLAALLSRDLRPDLCTLLSRGLIERTGREDDGGYCLRGGLLLQMVRAL